MNNRTRKQLAASEKLRYGAEEALVPLKWVKLKQYCRLSGDTQVGVHSKRCKGIWLDGVQCKIAADGNCWINLRAVEAWVENEHRG